MRDLFYLGIIFMMLLHSCSENEQVEGAVARVNDLYLMEEELQNVMPQNQTPQDSILFRNNYINTWATKQLLYDKALINVRSEDEEIKTLVEHYRRELLIDRYKKAVLQQDLDTVVTDEDLNEYYEMNKNVYRLNEDLLQLKLINFASDLNQRKEIEKLFRSEDAESEEILEERELEFFALSLNDSMWVSKTQAEARLPLLKEEKSLKKGQFIKKEDSLGVYLVAIKDVLHRNDVAPKSYVTPTIRQMILHNRKLELMNEIEKTLVMDAINNKQFEQY
ncbi:MAG: hypothetical protein WBV45_05645 [Lutimonas sp.]